MDAESRAARTILVVDDEADIREMVAQVLEDEGYTVTGAANGAEALALLGNGRRPHLILLDLMMPVMDGWEFRRRQRADPQVSGIPVVVISADGDVRRKAAGIDAADYLVKPIQLNVLLELVGRYAC